MTKQLPFNHYEIISKLLGGPLDKVRDNLRFLLTSMSEEERVDFHLSCSQFQSKLIEEHTELKIKNLSRDLPNRKHLIDRLRHLQPQIERCDWLVNETQEFSDHSLRGSIHFCEKFLEKLE